MRKIGVLAHRDKAKPARSIWCILPWALRRRANNFSALLRRIPVNPSATAGQCPRRRRGAGLSRRQRDKISGWSILARHPCATGYRGARYSCRCRELSARFLFQKCIDRRRPPRVHNLAGPPQKFHWPMRFVGWSAPPAVRSRQSRGPDRSRRQCCHSSLWFARSAPISETTQ